MLIMTGSMHGWWRVVKLLTQQGLIGHIGWLIGPTKGLLAPPRAKGPPKAKGLFAQGLIGPRRAYWPSKGLLAYQGLIHPRSYWPTKGLSVHQPLKLGLIGPPPRAGERQCNSVHQLSLDLCKLPYFLE